MILTHLVEALASRCTGLYSAPNRKTSAPMNEPKSLALGSVADSAMKRIREAGRPIDTTCQTSHGWFGVQKIFEGLAMCKVR